MDPREKERVISRLEASQFSLKMMQNVAPANDVQRALFHVTEALHWLRTNGVRPDSEGVVPLAHLEAGK